MNVRTLIRNKVITPLVVLLKQGTSPALLAWSVALGAVLGVIPVLGVTTLLCTLVALPLRLNLVAIQAANWLVYPLQFVLIIPLFRAGEWLFRQPPLDLKPDDLLSMFKADFWGSIQSLWGTTWHALVFWLLAGIPAVLLLQIVLKLVFSASAQRLGANRVPTEGADV